MLDHWPVAVTEKLKSLPASPGVYMMKDGRGRVLYVGKAASLRARVRSYFQSSKDMHVRTVAMIEKIEDLDVISTDTQMEALLLESNLIKKHRPPFNVKMRDDKRYPMLEVTLGETWPRLRLVRRPLDRSSRYFGPYTNSQVLRKITKVLARAFRIRTCALALDRPLDRPCLEYHIQQCTAPCTRFVGEDEYRASVLEACQFLDGHTGSLLRSLRAQMQAASEKLDFERCIRLRNVIHAVEQATERQKMIADFAEDLDVLGLVQKEATACVTVLAVREGKLVDEQHFVLDTQLVSSRPEEPEPQDDGVEETSRSTVRSFLTQYYGVGRFIPPAVLIPEPIGDADLVEQWLTGLRTSVSRTERTNSERAERALLAEPPEPPRRAGDRRTRVRLYVPRRGARRDLVKLATRNAALHLSAWRRSEAHQDQRTQAALDELQQTLDLPRPPWRIECYDISNIQGKNPVASMVVFEKGQPKTSDYRRFKIRGDDTPDDFRMMEEVLTRRLGGRADERKYPVVAGGPQPVDRGQAHLPDLLMVDGGKGQLSVAVRVLEAQGCQHVPVCGLAKQEELIFLPGRSDAVRLDLHSPGLLLLRRVRDESHRFAITFHRQLRGRGLSRSLLDQVPGIGRKRKRDLLNHFGSLGSLMDASIEQIKQVHGVGDRLAASIHAALHAPSAK